MCSVVVGALNACAHGRRKPVQLNHHHLMYVAASAWLVV